MTDLLILNMTNIVVYSRKIFTIKHIYIYRQLNCKIKLNFGTYLTPVFVILTRTLSDIFLELNVTINRCDVGV